MIPYVDLGRANGAYKSEILAAVERVLDHGQLILGPEVAELESAVMRRLDAKHVVGVSNGTSALVIGLRLASVGPGDEVIVPSHSFVATATAVSLLGARPVFVDIDEATHTLDPDCVEVAFTSRTRAVIPVHLGGVPANVEALSASCRRRGVALVEDCAQAFGARIGGRSVGTFGIGCFSLHPLKVFSAAGDAGLLAVGDASLADGARRLRNLGLVGRGVADVVSGNDRLDTLQAAILLVKLAHLDQLIAARREHAAHYRRALGAAFRLVDEPEGAECVHSTFVIRHPKRDALVEAMLSAGIEVKVHYPVPIHRQPAFVEDGIESLPVTERIVSEIVSLPVSPELSSDERSTIIDRLLSWSEAIGGPADG